MTASAADIPAKLLDWYERHARDLPWRAQPGEPAPDPYHVWLSEVMLQQTTVAAAKPYFAKFLAIWPTVEALAGAPEEEVMAAWAGLGYYSRARNLVKAARAVAELGAFPATEDQLRNLPGLGAYTAAAIAAIAFGQRAVVVDANVERVVARLFTIVEPLPGARKAIRRHAETITPDERAGDFAQAMMDLGSGICTTRAPKCLLCPLAQDCGARPSGEPERFPVKPPKQAKPERVGHAWWITNADRVLLVRRAGTGMLGGMRALPDDGWTAQANGSGQPPVAGEWRECGAVRHGFTHANLTLHVRALEDVTGSDFPDGDWWPLSDLDDAGLPTLFAKAARLALAEA